jgi:magnesium-transporting ATPase (P-type)
VTGEPTEGALKTLARKAEFDEREYQRTAVIPFESETKFMATLNREPEGGARIMMKGAPDRLLDRSTTQLNPTGSPEPLDRMFWEKQIKELSNQGLRVLAAATRDVDGGRSDLTPEDLESMVFIGLVGIVDPPRIEAIRICREAGIRVKMITGDHAGTAKSIGKEMRIGDGQHAVTGEEYILRKHKPQKGVIAMSESKVGKSRTQIKLEFGSASAHRYNFDQVAVLSCAHGDAERKA